MPLSAKRIIKGVQSEYGLVAKPSDSIGILVKFSKQGKAKITCYKNLVNCGILAENVSGPIIPIIGL